jgi:hypothetical protein
LSFLVAQSPVSADNLNSTNYQLVDPEVEAISGTAASSQYKSLFGGGSGIYQGNVSSSLYHLGSGQGYTFMANVPKITCFETVSIAVNSSCTTLDSSNGMQGICGDTGCYDRAFIEIDTQENPADTLYSIEISPDNFVTRYIVSGGTRTLKSVETKALSDYLTKTQWEASPWQKGNILGLIPDQSYQVRVTALQGDFTESSFSPTKTAETATTYATLDLDIATDFNTENNAPYAYNLGKIAGESYLLSSTALIKADFSTNAQTGVELYVQDQYSGLKSLSTNYLLASTTEDLSLPANGDGFGLQVANQTESAGSLGKTILDANYAHTGTTVGSVSSAAAKRIACVRQNSGDSCSAGLGTWVSGASVLLKVGVRASFAAPPVNDFQDQLQFTLIGNW